LHLVSLFLVCRTLILLFINVPDNSFLFIANNSYFINCDLVQDPASATKMNSNQTLFSSVTLLHQVPSLRFEVYNVCVNHPMKIISDGILNHHASAIPSQSSFTMLELQFVIIFVITQSFHFILKRLGIPYFVSQVMVGIYPFILYIVINFLLLVSIPSFGFCYHAMLCSNENIFGFPSCVR